MKRSTKIALGVLLICVVVLVIWLARPAAPTDTQQIQAQLQSALMGAQQHSVGAIMSVISPNYVDDNGMNPDKLSLLLSRAYQSAPSVDVTMTDPIINVSADMATSDCTLNVTEAAGQSVFSHVVHLDWKKEKATTWLIFPTTKWRVVDADYGGDLEDME